MPKGIPKSGKRKPSTSTNRRGPKIIFLDEQHKRRRAAQQRYNDRVKLNNSKDNKVSEKELEQRLEAYWESVKFTEPD